MKSIFEELLSARVAVVSMPVYSETKTTTPASHTRNEPCAAFPDMASPEAKDAFYRKLAGVLLKGEEWETPDQN